MGLGDAIALPEFWLGNVYYTFLVLIKIFAVLIDAQLLQLLVLLVPFHFSSHVKHQYF